MKLSDCFLTNEIYRDSTFEILALSNCRVEKKALSFLDDVRYLDELNNNKSITAVICKEDIVPKLSAHITGIVVAQNPRRRYFELHNQLAQTKGYCAAQNKTVISKGCQISTLAYIDSIGVVIEEDVIIEEFVSIKGPCHIGAHTVIRAGAKVGGSGYEFKNIGEEVLDVTHCGSVEIGSNVIIWENATIHKAVYPWDVTRVETGARIGANSHIDHGVKVGSFAKICAGAIISGRTEIGTHAYIGPGAVISNRLVIGTGAKASLGSVVTKSIQDGQTVSGNFAISHEKHIEQLRKIR